ncbi:bacterial Ig-like domain-containing protein, partial [Proteiniclasticum ruminis]
MKQFKKTISFLLLFVYLSAIFVQNVAIGTEIGGESPSIEDFIGVQVSKNQLTDGETQKFTVALTGYEVPIYGVSVEVAYGEGFNLITTFALDDIRNNVWEVDYQYSLMNYSGMYKIVKVNVDTSEGRTEIFDLTSEFGEKKADFSNAVYEVMNTYGGINPIKSIKIEDVTYSPGEIISLTVEVDESNYQIETLDIYFLKDGENFNFPMKKTDVGVFSGEFHVESFSDNGTYTLDRLILVSNNQAIYVTNKPIGVNEIIMDLSPYKFTIEGGVVDSTAPQFISAVIPEIVYPGTPSVIEYEVTEEGSGLKDIVFQFEDSDGHTLTTYSDIAIDGTKLVLLEPHILIYSGIYKLKEVSLLDFAGNKVVVNDRSDEQPDNNEKIVYMDLSSYTLELQGTMGGIVPELVLGKSSDLVTNNQSTSFSLSITNAPISFSNAMFKVRNVDTNQERWFTLESQGDNFFDLNLSLDESLQSGQYKVERIDFYKDGLSYFIYDEDVENSEGYPRKNLDAWNFAVQNDFIGYNPSFTVVPILDPLGSQDEIFIQVKPDSFDTEFKNMNIVLVNTEDTTIRIPLVLHFNPNTGYFEARSNIYLDTISGNYNVYEITYNFLNGYDRVVNELYASELEKSQSFPSNILTIEGTLPSTGDIIKLEVIDGKESYGPEEHIRFDVNSLVSNSSIKHVNLFYENEEGRKLSVYGHNTMDGFRIEHRVNPYTSSGRYKLKNVWVEFTNGNVSIGDINQNEENYSRTQDFSHMDLTIAGTISDTVAPVLNKLTLSGSVLKFGEDMPIMIDIEENVSGVSYIQFQYKKDDSEDRAWVQVNKNEQTGQYFMTTSADTKSGDYTLMEIMISDNAGNYSIYYNKDHYSDEVNGELRDFSDFGLQIESFGGFDPDYKIKNHPNSYTMNDIVNIEVELLNETYKLDTIEVLFSNNQTVVLINDGNNRFIGEYLIKPDETNGIVEMKRLIFRSKSQYVLEIGDVSDNVNGPGWNYEDLSEGDFTVEGTLNGITPEITVSTNKSSVSRDEYVKVSIKVTDTRFKPESIGAVISVTNAKGINGGVSDSNFQYDSKSESYVMEYHVYNDWVAGDYQLTSVSFKVGDSWFSSEYEIPLFTVQGTLGGYQPDVSAAVNMKSATVGDEIVLTFRVDESTVNFSGGEVWVQIRSSYGDSTSSRYAEIIEVSPGVFQAKLPIHEYSTPGDYSVRELYLYGNDYNIRISDVSNEYAQYVEDLSAAEFEVYGTKVDLNEPKLISIIVPQNSVYVGEIFEIELNLDEESGIERGSVQLVNVDDYEKGIYLEVETVNGKVIAKSNNYDRLEAGNYRVQRVSLVDYAGNSKDYLHMDGDDWDQWTERIDFTDTVITAKYYPIEDITFKLDKETYTGRDYLELKGTLSFDIFEYMDVQFLFENELGNQVWLHGVRRPSGYYAAGTYIRPNTPVGTYTLKEAKAYKGGIPYALIHDETKNESGYKDLSGVSFTIEGTVVDWDAPILSSVRVSKTIASPNDSIMLQVFATDAASGLNFGTATYVNTVTRKTNHIYIHKYGMNELRGYWDIRNSTDPGEWVLKHIELVDESENFIIYTDESLGEVYGDENLRDFSNANITVMGTAVDEDPPVFIGASLSKKELRNFEQFEIKINALDYVAGVERYLIFYRGDGEHETVFDGWGTSIYGMISLRDTAPDEVLLEATDLFIYDYEGNELHVTREEGRLENLDILITDTKAADVNQYVYEAYVHRGELEFGQEVDITVVPGYDTMDAKKVTLYYREIGKEPFTIVAEPFEGEFVAKFLPSNPNYKEKTEYEFMYMEIIQSNDEVVTLYTTAYPESDLIFYAESMNFSILEDTTAKLPEIIGFTTENKTVGADASIQFNLEYNASGYLPSKYEVYFRTGDTLVDSPIRINDMKNQVFYTDAFTVEGAYQVDQLVVFGPNGDALRINNSKVHSDEEIPSLDFGDLSFTVSGTLSDKAAPTVSGWSTGSKIVELGETQMFTVSALDDKTGIAYGVLYLLGPSGDISTSKPVYLYFNESTDLLEGSYKVTEETAIGQYQVAYMEVYDKAMNMTKVSNILIPEFAEQGTDLAELDFEVDGIAPDLDAPIFTSIDTVSEESVQNGVITLKVNSHDGIAENASGLKNMKFTYFADGISRTIYSDIYLENGEHYTTVRLDAIYGFEWVLRNLEIYDFAGNKTVIYHSTSNNTSSYRDLTAGNYKFEKPFITPSIESLTLDKNEVLPGEELLITLRLLTTSILPETVEAHFKSATYNQSKMTELAITPDGKHVGIDRISEFELDGEWRLEKLTAKDPYGNTYEILLKDTSFENTVYTVKDTTPDDESAELQDINISKVENNLFRRMMFSMTNLFTTTTTISEFTLGDTIRFSVNAEDAVSGVSKIKLEYTVVNQKVVIEEDLISAGGSKYTGEFTIQEFHPSGDWRLDKITLFDNAENETILVKSETTGFVPGYSKLNFRVTGTQPDRTAPIIGGITVSSSRVLLGDKITYTVEASDEESEVKEMTLRLISVKTGVMKNVTMKKVNDTSFQGILTVTPDMPGSTWRVERITAKDTMNNEAVVTNTLLGTSTLSTRRDLKVSEVTVVTEQRIEVVSPAEVSLNLGDIYNGEDLTVRLIYSEGEPKILTKDQLRIGVVDTTKIGATRVTIAYNALSTSIPVTVSEGAAASIRISKEPEMRFFEGDAYTSEGLEMEVTYENGYKRVLPVLKSSVTGYDSTQIGLQTLTVTYLGKTTEYKIEVEKIQVESIEVKNAPSKTEYIEGQEFDRTGIVVEATMNNGSKEMISSDDLSFAGFDSSIAVKNQEITVTYEGKSDTFTVNIIPKVLTEIEIAT